MPSINGTKTPRGKTLVRSGLHIIRKAKAGQLDRWYVYAWRGGPRIHVAEGARPVIGPDLLGKADQLRRESRHATGTTPKADTLDAQIDAYRASPKFDVELADGTVRKGTLAAGTQVDYRLWLDRISKRFGSAPLEAFTDPRMRGVIIDWRDQWAHQPRTADRAAGQMCTLLAWIVDRGRIPVNVAAGIEHLHQVDRSDLVWERRHARAWVTAPRHVRDVLKIAGLTGLRLAALPRLSWEHVGKNAIRIDGLKRGRRAVIPITPALRHHLNRLEKRAPRDPQTKRPTGPVLLNSRKNPWSREALKTAIQRATPKGFDRHLHDLRGTFCTQLILAGLTDDQTAMLMGWDAKRIARIRARYVNEERVVIELAEQMARRANG